MTKLSTLLLLLVLITNAYAGGDEEMQTRVNESRAVIKEFAGQLVGRLQQALQEGGPENAIQVCNIAAPGIASNLSDKYNWSIERTSLKIRNPNNEPDAWEQTVLKGFEQRKQNGADVTKLDYYEMTPDGFRYMKAIPTQALCLTCHGETVADSVKSKLAELYPNDKATGFKIGDIRGAFTIIQRASLPVSKQY